MTENEFTCPLREDRCPVFTKNDASDIKTLLQSIHENQQNLIERDQRHDSFVRVGLIIVAGIAGVAAIAGVM